MTDSQSDSSEMKRFKDRRSFIAGAAVTASAAMLGLAGCRHTGRAAVTSAASAAPDLLQTLAAAGRQRGLLVGSAVDVKALRASPEYAQLIRQQCSIVVGENVMKFGPMRPAPDTYFFEDADYLVDFAVHAGIQVRGHNFVWHRQLPAWFEGYATKANAERLLVEHIERVGGRYRGRIQSWDVCNEVIHLPDGQANGLRDAPWYRLLGPGYIDLAYRTARRVDPHALLCYNDYDIESEAPAQAAKRTAVLAMLRGMKQRGVPIDAMGIQGHISAGPGHKYGAGLTAFLNEVNAMDLKLFISEMDVNDRALPPANDARDRDVATRYKQFLDVGLANEGVFALLTWGLTDRYTWLNGEDSREDHLPERCLPFDAELKPTASFFAELDAIRQAPMRKILSNKDRA